MVVDQPTFCYYEYMNRLTLETPVDQLHTVGKTIAQRLQRIGIFTARDLLYHFPTRYEDFSNVQAISKLTPNQQVTIRGKIDAIQARRSYRRRLSITEALVTDETGTVKIIWFNQAYLAKSLAIGDRILVSGKLDMDKYGLHFTGPSYEKVGARQLHTGRLVPVYSTTDHLTQRHLRYLIQQVINLTYGLHDYLPDRYRNQAKLVDLPFALREIHFPKNEQLLAKAQHRLKFDELFPIHVYTLQNRRHAQQTPAEPIPFDETGTQQFVRSLPFTLTDAQRKAGWEILKDLTKAHPMNRLLEGDVGSGKTVVASLAIVNAAANGFQSVIMAPTEILAQQHFRTLSALLRNRSISVALLTRHHHTIDDASVTKATVLKRLRSGEIAVVIGTQALIQEAIAFKRLGLAIVDEQHRFGVEQREILIKKARESHRQTSAATLPSPHFLSLTATPIPRTLALSLYGDLDISIIDQLPAGRQPIETKIIPPFERKATYDLVAEQIKSGRQAFVICPLIDPSDRQGARSVKEEYEKLRDTIFPHFSIGLLHGRLSPDRREKVMSDFAENRLNILVSTSVIEVGIDIPNASVMLIEEAERFGLAQLHQFRGRVGRGAHQSYCFLLSESAGEVAIQRLQAVAGSTNGFELAEKDLEIRGPGELYGLKQSGFPSFTIAKLTDYPIINQSRAIATQLLQLDPELSQFPLIKDKMVHFRESIHWE